MDCILRNLRERARLSVVEAAGLIGVTRAAVYAWESGQKEPDKGSLLAACDVYNATEAERDELARLRAFGPTATDTAPAA